MKDNMANANQKSMVTDLTTGGVFSNLVRLAVPFMLSNLLQMLYSMIDMIVVGQYVAHAGQFALGVHVCVAECLFVDDGAFGKVCVPDHFAPMHAAAVYCAAVVPDDSFDVVEMLHDVSCCIFRP